MAGAGFDAAMIRGADELKERMGRAAYLWSGSRNLGGDGFGAEIQVDGTDWYEGRATCILFGNLGRIVGGVRVFPDARPDDGMLELGIVTAEGLLQWTRTLVRTAIGDPNRSPFVRTTQASSVEVALDRKVRYELDGGDRSKVKSFRVGVEERALKVCIPRPDEETI
jgi:diacylglycerol kinase (ATP)